MRRDYYAVLGIAATSAPREIRQAYRRLARQYSPDVNFWDTTAGTLFDEIAEAYRVLSDPQARAMYDRFGPGPVGGVSEAGRRGDDIHVTVELEFADAACGATLQLSVPRFSPCPTCGAAGRGDGGPCAACHGRGVSRVIDRVAVMVPPGVDSGTQVRVSGEGSAGPFGGPRGDLVVSTRVREHPFFARKGDGVHCELPIGLWEALRGARIRVPTPLGEGLLVVPPGTASDSVFRLRGQGLPRLTDGSPGDLYVTVRIEVPTGLDARTDELVRELERLLPGPSRADLARYRGGAS
ncbi:MAG TPA: J domain-containing protein [Methylomirabilota bacterium]|nr:J domain-containing protein [Methylomirabilota bacterium]